MYDRSNCPCELQGTYIEVATLRRSGIYKEEVAFIELWIATLLSSGRCREETQTYDRCPIHKVINNIEELADGKKVCLIIQSDDLSDDVLYSGESIALLLKYLNLESVLTVLFVKQSEAQLKNILQTKTFRNVKEKNLFFSLFDKVDAIVYEQANRYIKNDSMKIQNKNKEVSSLLEEFVNEFPK